MIFSNPGTDIKTEYINQVLQTLLGSTQVRAPTRFHNRVLFCKLKKLSLVTFELHFSYKNFYQFIDCLMSSYLVTGTSRGLGLAMVAHLGNVSDIPAAIIFAAARSQSSDLKDLIAESSGQVKYIEMDTTDPVSVSSVVETVQQLLGDRGLDYLINNAGVGGFAPGWTENL